MAETAGGEIVGQSIQSLAYKNPATLIVEGKVNESDFQELTYDITNYGEEIEDFAIFKLNIIL